MVCLGKNTFFIEKKKHLFFIKEKQTKNTRKIPKSLEFPGIHSLSQTNDKKKYSYFYKTRLALIVLFSVVAIFVNQLCTCSKPQKTFKTITVKKF